MPDVDNTQLCPEFLNIEIEETPRCAETDLNVIGATDNTTLRTSSYNSGAIQYVDSKRGDDGDPGTITDPVQSIRQAITNLGTTGRCVRLLNDDYPHELDPNDIPAPHVTYGRFVLESELGIKAQVFLRDRSDNKFSTTATGDSFIGHDSICGWNDYLYAIVETNYLYGWDGTSVNTINIRPTYKYSNLWKGILRYAYGPSLADFDTFPIDVMFAYGNKDQSDTIYKLEKSNTLAPFTGGNEQDTSPITVPLVVANSASAETGVIAFCPVYMTYVDTTDIIYKYYTIQRTKEGGEWVNKLYVGRSVQGTSHTLELSDQVEAPTCIETFYEVFYAGNKYGVNSVSVFALGEKVDRFKLEAMTGTNISAMKAVYYNNGLPLSDNDRLYVACENGDLYTYDRSKNQWLKILETGIHITKMDYYIKEGLYSVMYCKSIDDELYRLDLKTMNFEKVGTSYLCNDITFWKVGNGQYLGSEQLENAFYTVGEHDTVPGYNGWAVSIKYETYDIAEQSIFNGLVFKHYLNQHSGIRIILNTDDDEIDFLWCDFENITNKIYWYCLETITYNHPLRLNILNNNFKKGQFGVFLLHIGTYKIIRIAVHKIKALNNNLYNIEQGGIVGQFFGEFDGTNNIVYGIRYNNFFNIENPVYVSNTFATYDLDVHDNIFLNIIGNAVYCVSNKASVKANVLYKITKENYYNCQESIYYESIEAHPLFLSLLSKHEDFRLLSECAGALKSSPAIVTPYDDANSNTYTYIDNEARTINETYKEIDITSTSTYKISYTINIISITVEVIIEGSFDDVTYSTIFSTSYGTVGTKNETIEFNTLFKYIRVRTVMTGGTPEYDSFTVYLYNQDIGSHNVERVISDSYDTVSSIEIQYDPVKMIQGVSKSNEELVSNYEGYPSLISRKKQIRTFRFTWDEGVTMQGNYDPYVIQKLYGIQDQTLKLFFQGLSGNGDLDGAVNCSIAIEKPIDSGNEEARAWFPSNGFDVTQDYLTLTHIYDTTIEENDVYIWQQNVWKGFYVEIDGSGTYNGIYKIIYNSVDTLWLQADTTTTLTVSSKKFKVRYFRATLNTTVSELSNRYFSIKHRDDQVPPNVSLLEFLEVL